MSKVLLWDVSVCDRADILCDIDLNKAEILRVAGCLISFNFYGLSDLSEVNRLICGPSLFVFCSPENN
jgi:hypothetical protein